MDGRPARPEGERKEEKEKKDKAKRKKRSTGPSRVVPHRSTTPARTSLTSLFGWEAVTLPDVAAHNKMHELLVFIPLIAL